MKDREWCSRCRDVKDAHSSTPSTDPARLRDQLGELDRLMRLAPAPVIRNYGLIHEATLREDAQLVAHGIECGKPSWNAGLAGGQACLRWLAAQIRAVDELLCANDPRYSAIPADAATAWATSDGLAMVIPARRGRDLGSADGDRTSYGRRGTLRHRVVPSSIKGMRVRPVWIGALAQTGSDAAIRLGAALFPGLGLRTQASGTGFVAVGVDCPDQPASIGRQVAHLGGAHAIVWPELTIDDEALSTLQDELAAAALREGHGPEVVVAGSWHRQHGDHLRNSAPILDATGDVRAHHWKSVLFVGAQAGREMVEPGDEILVLACDRFLASVAICKDYCDLATEPPWPSLDVDLLLVPSMGGRSTMEGHIARAAQDVISHGLRVLVVQQGDPGDPDSRSFVLPAPRTPPRSCTGLEVDVEHLVTSIDAGR